ncbi:MAG: ribosome biogenesis GTPase YqeH [Erysipelothrix sp.]|nr:ribosome biogenesis GTPase YqeH [Erysipelothrix sp.]
MIKQCEGCGLIIQHTQPDQPGYSPKEGGVLCQSCYRLKHYGDISKVNLVQVDSDTVLEKLREMDALFIWVVDLFHLSESMVSGVSRHLGDKDILLVGTKRELLPKTVSHSKIMAQIDDFLREANIEVVDTVFVGNQGQHGKEDLVYTLKQHKEYNKFVFFGTTNAGKSTLINALAEKSNTISTSYLPGTTLDMLVVDAEFGTLIDSPGIQESTPLIGQLPLKALALLQPSKPIKPINYQLNGNQAMFIGGLGYIAFSDAEDLSVTCYLPLGIKVHRTKLDRAESQVERLQQDLLSIKGSRLVQHSIKQIKPKFDCVIHEVGFICITGNVGAISTYFPKEVTVTTRRAYI